MLRRLIAVLPALLVLVCAGPAGAATAPCRPDGGPTCHVWYAHVTSVNDGDTVYADIEGDGSHRVYSIRFTAIQAMEQRTHPTKASKRRGECNSVEATNRLEGLIRRSHWRVRLTAQDPAAHSNVRLKRSVAVKIGGRWQDTGLILIREGHALVMASNDEDAWNDAYMRAEQEAEAAHRFLWDPVHCGSGPEQDAQLKVWVNWNPPGFDSADVAGEWVKIRNLDPSRPVSLAHWWLRDSMLRRYTFAAGTTIAPGATLTLDVGRGQDGGGTRYWGLSRPIFENPGDAHHLGDGAYLFDPHGDLRASMVYPCVLACADPLLGAVAITAQPGGSESVRVRNVSGAAIDLYGYAVALGGALYAVPEGTVLQPGQTLQVDVGGSPSQDTTLHRHAGIGRRMLPDSGGNARVTTFSDITLACASWGSGSC